MPNSAQDFDLILLDLHARAAAVPLLATPQLVIDFVDIERQTGGQTFNNRDKRATMGLSGSGEAKHWLVNRKSLIVNSKSATRKRTVMVSSFSFTPRFSEVKAVPIQNHETVSTVY